MPYMKSIGTKVIAIVFLILLASLVAVLSYQISTASKLHMRQAIAKARAITAFCEQTRQFMGNIRNDSMFDDVRLLAEFEKDKLSGKPYAETKIYRTIPVVAAWTTARLKAEEMGYQFRVPKNAPRNPLNQPRPGLEQSVVDYLEGSGSLDMIHKAGGKIIYPDNPADIRKNGEIGVLFKGTETQNASEGGAMKKVDAVRFFRVIRLTDDCLFCHGDPKGSKDLLGFGREGWKTGEAHGAFEIISPLAGLRSDTRRMIRANIVLMLVVLLVAGVVFMMMFRHIITKPMAGIGIFLKRFGAGDLTGTLDIRSSDEIGVMAGDLSASVANLRGMVRELSETTTRLGSASEGLSLISTEMARAAERMNGRSDTVAAAADQISASITTVAAAGEESSAVVSNISAMTEEMSITFQDIARVARDVSAKVDDMARMGRTMSDAVGDVSQAVEEMAAAFRDVGRNTAHASAVSKNAAERFEDVNSRMEELEKASRQIGKVVGIIKDIADQTNMLALNAAIEAAGAGEAGKGFAVVAQEVKDLARQSAEATEEIAAQVKHIQSGTQDGVASIQEISRIVSEIATINGEIEFSMREKLDQTVTVMATISTGVNMAKGVADNAGEVSRMVGDIANSTGEASKVSVEVARNVEETSGGIKEVARASGEASEGATGVSRNMRDIRELSGQVSKLAVDVNGSANELSGLSGMLSGLVRKFTV